MIQVAPAVQDLARKLLVQEADESQPSEAGIRAAEKLRLHLSKLVGVSGYHALIARALALAKAEAAWLGAVQLEADGSLDGFLEAAVKQDPQEAMKGEMALLAQVLGLLITFIGPALTLRLVRDIWPEAALNDINSGAEETPS